MAYEFEQALIDLRERIDAMESEIKNGAPDDATQELQTLRTELARQTEDVFASLSPWERVQLARHPQRPRTLDFIRYAFTEFVELHGDRHFGDDLAVVGGPARLEGTPVMVVGHQKGKDAKDNQQRNFGMAHPEGFRKARRLMLQAEKFRLPLFTFLDIPGASPFLADEERGQAWAIAENLLTMSRLRTPIIVTVIGEGGSGGALALGIGDRVLMLQYSMYSVASPEGAASIVWKDAKFAPEAAGSLKPFAHDLAELGIIHRVVPEPTGGAHVDPRGAARALKAALVEELAALQKLPLPKLIDRRYEFYRSLGVVAP
jgi:acetyl-CoA carboxylase carboxyl transferase subunit alpha